jgi:hypothetical protein
MVGWLHWFESEVRQNITGKEGRKEGGREERKEGKKE